MRLTGIVRRIHLWSGVVLGFQVLLWMLSGVVMSWYHIDLVRGDKSAPAPAVIELGVEDYVPVQRIISKTEGAHEIELRQFLGRPVYEVRSAAGAQIFDALNGERLSPIGEHQARVVAQNGFAGEAELVRIVLIEDPGTEMRGIGPRPVWRAVFNDRLNTRIYVSPTTGEILRRRNDVWRLYDFFWMLHIMDYDERNDFNNPLLRIASAAGLLFAISGLAMLFFKQSRNLILKDVRKVRGKKP